MRHFLSSKIFPSYQNIMEHSDEFWVWFKTEMFPRLQSVSDAASLCALIDTEELLDYYNQRDKANATARYERFLLALMTEHNSPNLARWREVLPYAWWKELVPGGI